MKTPCVIASLALFTGCVSRSGPFVTNISTGGPNKLNVEKCYVEYDSFGDRMQSSGCVVQTLDLLTQEVSVNAANKPSGIVAPRAPAPIEGQKERSIPRDPQACSEVGGKWMRNRCYQD